MDPRLYDAAFTGNVNALLELIQQDGLILYTVTLTTSNTPMHIAALLGHTEFAVVVMQYCPRFATEVNQQGLTPIHLASANGHWEIVREMLVRQPDLVLIKDKDGKNFLHTAATRGRIQVLREVFSAESANELTPNGETILHLAVKHNQYQVLETSIQLVNQYQLGNELFNAKDKDGNTVLHLACARKEPQMVRLLVSDQTNLDMNVGNSEGLTPLDIVKRSMTGSYEDHEVQEILQSAGAELSGRVLENPYASTRQRRLAGEDSRHSGGEKNVGLVTEIIIGVAALFAGQCFQLGMNPPGGVWQEGATGINPNRTSAAAVDNTHRSYLQIWFEALLSQRKSLGFSHLKVREYNQHKPGESVSWELQNRTFLRFILYNAVCFYLSIGTILTLTLFAMSKRNLPPYFLYMWVMMVSLLVIAMQEFKEGVALVTNETVAEGITDQADLAAACILSFANAYALLYAFSIRRFRSRITNRIRFLCNITKAKVVALLILLQSLEI